ncbi:MAG: hypothetical protein J6S50_02285 [Oscillospiraceae bacterium]|nr:hypothetical protein [Oscillospiraceae bacterium]
MPVTVQMDRAHLSARMQRGKEKAGYAVANQILADSRPFVPRAEGTLEASGRAEKLADGYATTWNTVYAAYQYYGCWPDGSHVVTMHNHDINARATTQWVEAARAVYGDDWEKVAQREFEKGAR